MIAASVEDCASLGHAGSRARLDWRPHCFGVYFVTDTSVGSRFESLRLKFASQLPIILHILPTGAIRRRGHNMASRVDSASQHLAVVLSGGPDAFFRTSALIVHDLSLTCTVVPLRTCGKAWIGRVDPRKAWAFACSYRSRTYSLIW